jgi:hypothetical protein
MNIKSVKGTIFGDFLRGSVIKYNNSYYIKLHCTHYSESEVNALDLDTGELKCIDKESPVEATHASFKLNNSATAVTKTFGDINPGCLFLLRNSEFPGSFYMKIDGGYFDYSEGYGGNAIEISTGAPGDIKLLYMDLSQPVDHINDNGVTMYVKY